MIRDNANSTCVDVPTAGRDPLMGRLNRACEPVEAKGGWCVSGRMWWVMVDTHIGCSADITPPSHSATRQGKYGALVKQLYHTGAGDTLGNSDRTKDFDKKLAMERVMDGGQH